MRWKMWYAFSRSTSLTTRAKSMTTKHDEGKKQQQQEKWATFSITINWNPSSESVLGHASIFTYSILATGYKYAFKT